MIRYKKHTVRQGDTLQSIAQRETGNVNNWVKIVEYNKLVYPYIVEDAQNKMKNVEHLVTIGDSIIIPIEASLLDIDTNSFNRRDQDIILGLALGKDLNMTSNEKYYNTFGTSDEILELSANGKGDLDNVVGVANLKQAILSKLLTPKGSLMLHPEYGSNLHNLFEKATSEQAKLIEIEICRVVATDRRVKSVVLNTYKIEEDSYYGEYTVNIQSFQESFSFVVEGDSQGNIILT